MYQTPPKSFRMSESKNQKKHLFNYLGSLYFQKSSKNEQQYQKPTLKKIWKTHIHNQTQLIHTFYFILWNYKIIERIIVKTQKNKSQANT